MPKPAKGSRLGSGPAHEKLLLSGLVAALIRDERIRTTETKAKRLRPLADRMVTLGKQGSVASRRRALAVVTDRDVVHKLFAEVAPRFADRNGGYTRIIKLGPRQGDGAPMALIELVEAAEKSAAKAPEAEGEETGKRRGFLGRRLKGQAPTEEEKERQRRRREEAEASEEESEEDIAGLRPEDVEANIEAEAGEAEAEAEEPVAEEPETSEAESAEAETPEDSKG
jgi:large subunit ribosomal protein L17